MILAVASGKGGTGKTTVSVNLARVYGAEVQLVDCDVEEPNAHLFLDGVVRNAEVVAIPVPQVNESLCNACGECGRFCEYHAIVSFETLEAGPITLVQGRLDVGAPLAPPLIRAVKARLRNDVPSIIDAPPGTSCPVIATIRGADFVLLVTEPTPFGLHDLTLAVDMVRELGIPCGVVVNRAGIGDNRVHSFCKESDVPILAEIPDDRRIAEAYSRGKLVVDALPEYRRPFDTLLKALFESTAERPSPESV
jgi:MinD superfamily P-loop ATPase